MARTSTGFYSFWASIPPIVAVAISLLITAMLWFGALKDQILPDRWSIPSSSDLLNDQGSFVNGHNNWKQPYSFLSRKSGLIALFCDPVLPNVNRCLEEDGIYPSSYDKMPIQVAYFKSSGESGFRQYNIIAQIQSSSGVILQYKTRNKELKFAAAQSQLYRNGPFGRAFATIFSIFSLTMWVGSAISIYSKLRGRD